MSGINIKSGQYVWQMVRNASLFIISKNTSSPFHQLKVIGVAFNICVSVFTVINDRKKDLSQSLKKLGVDVDIAAELFFDGDGGPAQRQDKGAIGLDVLVRNKKTSKIMLGFDLKTGKAGTSRTKGKEYIRRHKGAPMIDIYVRRTK